MNTFCKAAFQTIKPLPLANGGHAKGAFGGSIILWELNIYRQ
jgi:hypothetical protein